MLKPATQQLLLHSESPSGEAQPVVPPKEALQALAAIPGIIIATANPTAKINDDFLFIFKIKTFIYIL